FAPVEAARAVIAVVIDEPRGKIYGGDVAAPVFSAIGGEVLRLLKEPAHLPERSTPPVLTADLPAGATGSRNAFTTDLLPAAIHVGGPDRRDADAPGRVPDLTGKGMRDAVRLLARRSLVAKLAGSGFVVSQDPPAGSPAVPGATVSLVLSLEPP